MLARVALLLAVVCHCYGAHHSHGHGHSHVTTTPQPGNDLLLKLDKMEEELDGMLRFAMVQQLFAETKLRNDGDSGIKQVPTSHQGNRIYQSETHSSFRGPFDMHDHSHQDRTLGLGVMNVVLNGVDFKTRHNDYRLVMPSTHSKAFRAEEDIAYPPVPPAVLSKRTVAQQVAEMREWFKAFHNNNVTHRDFRPYFKPVMCYLEGAWYADTERVVEPFHSDNYHLHAKTWDALARHVDLSGKSGMQDVSQSQAWLPKKIMSVANGTVEMGQWNYRILCHPANHSIHYPELLHPVDDLATRLALNLTWAQYPQHPTARFQLVSKHRNAKWMELDDIMHAIPGLDNYGFNLSDPTLPAFDMRVPEDKLLNGGYYHRWFRTGTKGAMGVKVVHRGFADQAIFMAQTTQKGVAPMSLEICDRRHACTSHAVRYSYALPLELVYLTPLHSWNPYRLKYKASTGSVGTQSVTVGGKKVEALNGTDKSHFYLTPASFFVDETVTPTAQSKNYRTTSVLDHHGNVRETVASGIRTILPSIPGVGRMRTRYPIMGLFSDGSHTYKEALALMDVLNNMPLYHTLFRESPFPPAPTSKPTSAPHGSHDNHVTLPVIRLHLSPAKDGHVHDVTLTMQQMAELGQHHVIKGLRSTTVNGHTHTMDVQMDPKTDLIMIVKCDNHATCSDGHPARLTIIHN